jgi:hypothetical protein
MLEYDLGHICKKKILVMFLVLLWAFMEILHQGRVLVIVAHLVPKHP